MIKPDWFCPMGCVTGCAIDVLGSDAYDIAALRYTSQFGEPSIRKCCSPVHVCGQLGLAKVMPHAQYRLTVSMVA